MVLRLATLSIATALTITLSGCGGGGANTFDQTSNQPHQENQTVEFSYWGKTGPTYWGTLKPEWHMCAKGLTLTPVDPTQAHQSPIDFTQNATPTDPDFILDADRAIPFEIENNGHTIEAVAKSDEDTLTIGDKLYTLKQFHFHAYSEHTQNNHPAAMEAHFVFKAQDGSLAVLGVFVDRDENGEENEELAKVFTAPLPAEHQKGEELAINITNIIPQNSTVYHYIGSLTTPPCSEGVEWNVFTKHIKLSEPKLVKFTKLYHNNFRPITGHW